MQRREAVQQGGKKGGRNGSKAAKAKSGTKGGAAGKGVKKPRMTAAEKELLPQGPCTGCSGGSEALHMDNGGGQGGGMRQVQCQ